MGFIKFKYAFFSLFSLMSLCLLTGYTQVYAFAYSDLPESHWAYDEIDRAASLRIMNGTQNDRMSPDGVLTWAQYLAMICRAFASTDYWTANQINHISWDEAGYQTAQNHGFLLASDFLPVTTENMRKTPITRQDAAVLLSRALKILSPALSSSPAASQNQSSVQNAENVLTDFFQMDKNRREAVSLLFDLGIVRGKPDGSFGPLNTIRRSDGAVLLMRTLDYIDETRSDERIAVTLTLSDESGKTVAAPETIICRVHESLSELATNRAPEDYKASAKNRGHISIASDSYTLYIAPMTPFEISLLNAQTQLARGLITQQEYETADFWLIAPGDNVRKRVSLYDDPEIAYYETEEDAKPNMVSVQVPVWRLDEKGKVADSMTVWVHGALAADVKAIFTEIYDDPEQFPFESMGGYNWGGTITTNEHRNGSAIDLNPDSNFCIRDGVVIAGSHWTPGDDPYSIPADGSVRRIFAEHGWSWGGDEWSGHTDQTYGYHDYMHFSYRGR